MRMLRRDVCHQSHVLQRGPIRAYDKVVMKKHGMRDASCESILSVWYRGLSRRPPTPGPLACAAAMPALHGAMTFSERRAPLAS